jgi:hypothetical protein
MYKHYNPNLQSPLWGRPHLSTLFLAKGPHPWMILPTTLKPQAIWHAQNSHSNWQFSRIFSFFKKFFCTPTWLRLRGWFIGNSPKNFVSNVVVLVSDNKLPRHKIPGFNAFFQHNAPGAHRRQGFVKILL